MSAVSVRAASLRPGRLLAGTGRAGPGQSSGQSGPRSSAGALGAGKSPLACMAPTMTRRRLHAGYAASPGTSAGRRTDVPSQQMADWWSIEVLHGEFSAFQWQQSYGSALIEAALTNGALDGSWHTGTWGVAFEVCFITPEEWEAFRNLPVVRAALDAVPDPVNGLLIYRGRGGASASGQPRRPRPAPSASSQALPEPA